MTIKFLVLMLCGLLFLLGSCKDSEDEKPRIEYYDSNFSMSFDGKLEGIGSYVRNTDSITVVSANKTVTVLLPTDIITETGKEKFPFDKSYVITFLVNGVTYQADNTNIWDDSSFYFYTTRNGYREKVDVLRVSLRFKDKTGMEHVFELGYDGRK